MRSPVAVFALAVIAAPGTAHAGRSFYGWLLGSEVMPERGAEIQSFVSEENRKSADANASNTDWWIGPSIGINDQLELLLPVVFSWSHSDVSAAKTTFDSYGAELRYRFVTPDPVDKPAFAPLVRVGVQRVVIGTRDHVQPVVDFVGAYDVGDLQLLGDVGVDGDLTTGSGKQHLQARTGAGLSAKVVGDLRIGAEVFAEIKLDDNGDATWVIAGPNVAWSHGRSWLSAAYGIGLYQIRDAPRLNWGIAF